MRVHSVASVVNVFQTEDLKSQGRKMSEICVKQRHPASFMVKEDKSPDVSLDEQLIEILGSLDQQNQISSHLQMNSLCTIPISISFFWECSALHFPRAPHKCTHHGPILFFSSCGAQLPGGIHFISQKHQPESKLCSPGTHCWLK